MRLAYSSQLLCSSNMWFWQVTSLGALFPRIEVALARLDSRLDQRTIDVEVLPESQNGTPGLLVKDFALLLPNSRD